MRVYEAARTNWFSSVKSLRDNNSIPMLSAKQIWHNIVFIIWEKGSMFYIISWNNWCKNNNSRYLTDNQYSIHWLKHKCENTNKLNQTESRKIYILLNQRKLYLIKDRTTRANPVLLELHNKDSYLIIPDQVLVQNLNKTGKGNPMKTGLP